MSQAYSPVRAPRGNTRTAKGWIQEAAKRMLMNNLDPEVAEKPEELIVYGGRGKAARNWECYHRIVETLESAPRENEQTLLGAIGQVQSQFLKLNSAGPAAVLIANSESGAAVGHLGRVRPTRCCGTDDVWPDDGWFVDLHRHSGNSARNL